MSNIIAFRRDFAAPHRAAKLSMNALPTALQDVLANWFDLVSGDLGDEADIVARLCDDACLDGDHCLVISTARSNDPRHWALLHLPVRLAGDLHLSAVSSVHEQFIGDPFLEAILDQVIMCQVSGRPAAMRFFGAGDGRQYACATVFLPVTNDIGQPVVTLVGIAFDAIPE